MNLLFKKNEEHETEEVIRIYARYFLMFPVMGWMEISHTS